MAVSKRTRFEVLKRDNYTCRYCGGTAPDVTLTVDHVTPVALGGSDDPSNLVAACKDCNAGKTSTSPDAQTIANVADDALRWAQAIAKASEITDAKAKETADLLDWFGDKWVSLTPTWAELPQDYKGSVVQFTALGLTRAALLDAIETTGNKRGIVEQRQMFRYFCGICWAKIRELQRIAAEMLAVEEG